MNNVPARALRKANCGMAYTDKVVICDSCGRKYDCGFMTEIKGEGIFCEHCFKDAIERYFEEHPGEEYLLMRGISSLAHRRRAGR
jgi:recombinational DNA repair protein (RecF pathway)